MRKTLLLIALLSGLSHLALSQSFTDLNSDGTGDGNNAALLDGTALAYRYDDTTDSLFFRVSVANINAQQAGNLGVNLMFNIPGAGPTFNFWGAQNTAAWHVLLTTWVTGSAPSNYSGTIGLANAMGVNGSNFTNLSSGNLSILVDVPNAEITIGLSRPDLVDDALLPDDGLQIGVAAAVGSSQAWNDDIYQAGTTFTLVPGMPSDTGNQAPVGVFEADAANAFTLFPNPANDQIFLQGAQLTSATICDLTGKPVRQIFQPRGAVDIAELPAGLYLFVGRDQNGRQHTQRLIKR